MHSTHMLIFTESGKPENPDKTPSGEREREQRNLLNIFNSELTVEPKTFATPAVIWETNDLPLRHP